MIPILELLILTFFMISSELFDKAVNTIKKAHELMSVGIL